MSNPPPVDADVVPAQQDSVSEWSTETVFVLGAGFTRAFVPKSPLMVDDFGNDEMEAKVIGLPHASRILEQECKRNHNGLINIERLMTRLDSLMPYDLGQGAADEFKHLLSEVRKGFRHRIESAVTSEDFQKEALDKFVRNCDTMKVNFITFNYDDILDRALYEGAGWDPSSGYGFLCLPSRNVLGSYYADTGEPSKTLLLKLHGSVNWMPKVGYMEPYVMDAITHHAQWWSPKDDSPVDESTIRFYLESEPLMIPPVLSKSGLVEQPVLRLVWRRAFELLAKARSVVFLGYSFPTTDVAAQTIFHEALEDFSMDDVLVVNLAESASDQEEIRDRYQAVLGDIPEDRFNFQGVLEWSRAYFR